MRKIYFLVFLILGTYSSLFSQSLNKSSLDEIGDLRNGINVTVTLGSDNFIRKGNLSPESFELLDAPAELGITQITVSDNDSNQAVFFIRSTDFDVDYPNFRIRIHDSVLNVGTPILTDICSLVANLERATLTTDPTQLTERNFGAESPNILIHFNDEVLIDRSNLKLFDFQLIGFPAGAMVTNINFTDNNDARLTVNYTPGDFDLQISGAAVTIHPAHLSYSLDTLGTSTISINALVEACTVDTYTDLHELTLDQGEIEIDLVNDRTTSSGTLSTSHFDLVSFPAGTSIESVTTSNRTHLLIKLAFDGTDFDGDDTNGRIRVKSSILTWNKTDDLLTDAGDIIIIEAPPAADATPGSWLREYLLNGATVDVDLSHETFSSPGSLAPGNFSLLNAPTGLNIGGVLTPTSSGVTLVLSFTGSDFDVSYNNVRVSIINTVLTKTGSGTLVTGAFSIDPNIEPVISQVSIPDNSMKIGDDVTATIMLSDFTVDSVYSLAAGGTIGGYSLSPGTLQWVDDDEYEADFTVTEGGNDYLGLQNIPFNNIRLDDSPVQGEPLSGSIIQDFDLLDANKPELDTLLIIGEGDKKIGDNIILLIPTNEKNLIPDPSTRINNVFVGESNVIFESISDLIYSLTYTIESGDQSVSTGSLQAEIFLRDPAGNMNDIPPPIQSNVLSIDATIPIIDSIKNTTPTDTVVIGDEVVLTIYTDGSNYQLSANTVVNGVSRDEGLIFTPSGNIYTLRYPVSDGDPSVAAGNLQATIILEDVSGNESLSYSTILNNDVAVLTEKPTALITGSPEVCIYDTAELYITLDGAPPWRVKYRNTVDSFYLNNILSPSYTLRVSPAQTTNYYIDSVWDGTGNRNEGLGTSLVIINPLPVLNILDLDTIYPITYKIPVDLRGDPVGGSFSGPGVNSVTNVFSPPSAGLSGITPHWIYYEYTDAKLCYNIDSQYVFIVEAEVQFVWEDTVNPVACYLDQDFTLTAKPPPGISTGWFEIKNDTTPAGFWEDNKDNTITFHPASLPWDVTNRDFDLKYVITFTYADSAGREFPKETDLIIEYFDRAAINPIDLEPEECSYDRIIPLTGTRQAGIFTGPGIDPSKTTPYEFNTSKADTGVNWIMYTYTSPNLCVQKDSVMVTVHEVPEPAFEYANHCVSTDGGWINFNNISDTLGLGGSLEWVWNYGDIQSGVANQSKVYKMDTVLSHYYPKPGTRTVSLTAEVLETGCKGSVSILRYLGNTPDMDLEWNTECFTGELTEFSGLAETDDGFSIYNWKITDMSDSIALDTSGSELKDIAYKFSSIENYGVELTAVSDSACAASLFDTIYLRPYIQVWDTVPYSENFEGDAAGWFAFRKDTSQMSWKLGTVLPEEFPYDLPDDGNSAWYTDIAFDSQVEQSWVSSPCFNFSEMRRPMISLDRKVSSDRDRDGTALQYTVDDGKNWQIVGAVDDQHINWYNSFRIQDGPGDQGEGWTGGFTFNKFENWEQSRHDLDELTGRSRIQFRIAYGNSGQSLPEIENEGFAFDNIWIAGRTRVVLAEHFTNAGVPGGWTETYEANTRLNQLVRNNPLDVIDIQYHAEVSGKSDLMNEDNPAPAGARSLFYGTTEVPYLLLDGGASGEMAYDFGDDDLDTLDLFARALTDPSFKINLKVDEGDNSLGISIGIEALEILPESEYMVYTVIVEKTISEPAYLVSGFDTAFENVVRDMVPNAAGISLIRSWNTGDMEIIPMLSWGISDMILNRDRINVVVFIQNAQTREVYQAASDDPDLNGEAIKHTSIHSLLNSSEINMVLYPNPASNHVYLAFDKPLRSRVDIQLFTHTGSIVRYELLQTGTEIYEMDLSGLSKGIYFIRAVQNGRIIGTKKFLIMQ